jgi:hypothetical protein
MLVCKGRALSWSTVIFASTLALSGCRFWQSVTGSGPDQPYAALYQQMDQLKADACTPTPAGASRDDQRARVEKMAASWQTIHSGVAQAVESESTLRGDRPHPSTALAAYWLQWQRAVRFQDPCFAVSSLSPEVFSGLVQVRASGGGRWRTASPSSEQDVSDDVVEACSTPEVQSGMNFERCVVRQLEKAPGKKER